MLSNFILKSINYIMTRVSVVLFHASILCKLLLLKGGLY